MLLLAYKVVYIFEYILNCKSFGNEAQPTNRYKHRQYFLE